MYSMHPTRMMNAMQAISWYMIPAFCRLRTFEASPMRTL